jgi:hypothetical protein
VNVRGCATDIEPSKGLDMDTLCVAAAVNSTLNWNYRTTTPSLIDLYEKAKIGQWNASTDIDWSLEVPFGAPLPSDSTFGQQMFAVSPLARGGVALWDRFRWEQQVWMVSQFLHGEQGALVATARLAEVLPDMGAKYYAATQVLDEARHIEAFSRYLDKVPHSYPISQSLATLLEAVLSAKEWDFTALGMQVVIEPLALGAFRAADATLHDPLIRQIVQLVARDEARHVAFGIQLLREHTRALSGAELAQREDFVITAADLMVKRLLLEDVWERVGVARAVGVQFAATQPMMQLYRRTVFAKVVSTLERIGLMTPAVTKAFDALGLQRRRTASASI